MKYIKDDLKNRTPYHSKNIVDGIILNANESPFDTPKEVKEYIVNYVKSASLNRYPDMDLIELREAISKKYNCSSDNITCGVGSDQLLDCIIKACIKDEYVLVCNPSFSMYTEYAELGNAKVEYAKFNDDFTFNIANIIEKIKELNPKVTFLCTPNNPTGASIKREDLLQIIDLTKGIIVIDEAYSEFADEDFYDLALKYDNVIVLKTFSKAYGLAAMRIGYAISTTDNIDMLNIVKPPYNLSSVTQEAAKFVISNTHLYDKHIAELKESRRDVYERIKALGIEIYPSQANFLWMRLSDKIFENLSKNKIYIRTLFYNGERYYRINIGTKKENALLLEAIEGGLKDA